MHPEPFALFLIIFSITYFHMSQSFSIRINKYDNLKIATDSSKIPSTFGKSSIDVEKNNNSLNVKKLIKSRITNNSNKMKSFEEHQRLILLLCKTKCLVQRKQVS